MIRDKIAHSIGGLTPSELGQLEFAANSGVEGGDPIVGPLMIKAVKQGLVFESSGRLKPQVIRYLLRGDDPLTVDG